MSNYSMRYDIHTYGAVMLLASLATVADAQSATPPGCGGCGNCHDASPPSATLLERLKDSARGGKVLFGHHDDTAYGHTWRGEEGRSDVMEVTGAYPAMMSWDLGGLECGDSVNLDGVSFDLMHRESLRQNARGGVNTFSWHLRHPLTDADCWTVTDPQAVHSIVATPEGREAYNRQLDRLADFFLSLTDCCGRPVEVIFRPWHEHTGGWFWWGAQHCSPDDYRQLWTLMRERFDSRGVGNVVWAYSPDRCNDATQYLERYPGDEYVDILGADVYHFNGAEGTAQYLEAAGRTLAIANEEARKRDKVAAFTETGCESLPIADWYGTVLLPLLSAHSPAYVTVWRNADDKPQHFYTPYKGHPAEADFTEFCRNPAILMLPAKER